TAAAAAATAAHEGINYIDLMLKASVPVQLIVLLLLVGSVLSWVIIFRKARIFRNANREADDFESRFWSGADLGKLYSDATERNLELLANIGSTAPYVGLVGTVFGIMVTMHDMLNSGEQTGIAAVAPRISEALFATAMGLFVAIPAVWAYNRFTTRVERLAVR